MTAISAVLASADGTATSELEVWTFVLVVAGVLIAVLTFVYTYRPRSPVVVERPEVKLVAKPTDENPNAEILVVTVVCITRDSAPVRVADAQLRPPQSLRDWLASRFKGVSARFDDLQRDTDRDVIIYLNNPRPDETLINDAIDFTVPFDHVLKELVDRKVRKLRAWVIFGNRSSGHSRRCMKVEVHVKRHPQKRVESEAAPSSDTRN